MVFYAVKKDSSGKVVEALRNGTRPNVIPEGFIECEEPAHKEAKTEIMNRPVDLARNVIHSLRDSLCVRMALGEALSADEKEYLSALRKIASGELQVETLPVSPFSETGHA